MKQTVLFSDLGTIGYQEAWHLQEQLLRRNLDIKSALGNGKPGMPGQAHEASATHNTTRHYLLFLEHPPVYTLGKSGIEEHVLISDEERTRRGIQFFRTNRGGDITFHGPGQIVGYPIFDLEKMYTDIGRYMRELEEVVIQTLAEFGISSGRSAGETGVWLDANYPGRERKICALGVRCSRWVTMHGFALNVNTNLDYFDDIIPCGIRNKQVTSMEKELGEPVPLLIVKEKLKEKFEAVFGVQLVEAIRSGDVFVAAPNDQNG
jgi:lipoyl(octanoyl) transferase